MPKNLLFDLDNTLIGNPMSTFLPAYFKALAQYTEQLAGGGQFIAGLLTATRSARKGSQTGQTIEAMIWKHLEGEVGIDRVSAETILNNFYTDIFPTLEPITTRYPIVRKLIKHCFQVGYRVVIATNPLYPQAAIEERLRWAGIPVSEFDYALITHYGNMHAAKPSTNYYEQILSMLGAKGEECMMVGDDWDNDIVPAAELGMQTFWVPGDERIGSEHVFLTTGYGSLGELLQQLQL